MLSSALPYLRLLIFLDWKTNPCTYLLVNTSIHYGDPDLYLAPADMSNEVCFSFKTIFDFLDDFVHFFVFTISFTDRLI